MDVRAPLSNDGPHPQRGRPSFVPWLGYEDQFLLEQLAEAGLPMTAKSRLQDLTNGQIALRVRRDHGMGLALAPETWRNQLPLGAHHRPANFEQLPYALRKPFDPNRDVFEPEVLKAYSESTIDSQLDCGATLIATAGHVVDEEQRLGRTTELRIAEAASSYFSEQRLQEPAPDDEHQVPRVLYATIIVSARQLTPKGIWGLIRDYGGLDVHGYWVVVNDLRPTAPQNSRVAQLCFGLEAATDRPVLLSGAHQLHITYLASGLAATSIGPGEKQTFVYPPPRPPVKNDKGDRPRRLPILHEESLYSFAYRREGEWADKIAEAFETYDCSCGHHDADRPPADNTETKRHTTALNLSDVTALRAAPDAKQWTAARLAGANAARAWLRLRPLDTGWGAVQLAAEETQRARDVRTALGL
jgi:hypothetical protein